MTNSSDSYFVISNLDEEVFILEKLCQIDRPSAEAPH